MKNTLLVALITTAPITSAYAVQYSVSGGNFSDVVSDTAIIDNTGAPIEAGGGYVAIGSFSSDPAGLGLADLAGAFTAVVSGSFDGAESSIGAAATGFWTLSGAPDSADAPVVEAGGKQVYLAFSSGDSLASGALGVIAVDGATFEAAFEGPGPFSLTGLGVDGNTAVHGAFGPGVEVSIGGNPQAVAASFQLVVPEPSTSLLAALAGLGLVARRRR